MQLTKNFSLAELTHSITARNRGIKNEPNAVQIENLKALCEKVLQPLRDKMGRAIHISSGFRSPELNVAIGGAKASQHMAGEAADITLGTKELNKRVFETIKKNGNFDQLIDEYDFQWVHVSWKRTGINRKQILAIK